MTDTTVEIDADTLAFIVERAEMEYMACQQDPTINDEAFFDQFDEALDTAQAVLDET